MNTCIYNGIRSAQGKGSLMLAAFALLALTGFETALAQTYTLTDLGTLGGADSRAYGINNFGQIAGTASHGESYTLKYCQWECLNEQCSDRKWKCNDVPQAKQRAFLWTPSIPGQASGTMTDLGTLGGPDAHGVNLNESGQVIGYSNTSHVRTFGGRDLGYSYEYHQNYGFLWTPDQPNTTNTTRGSMLNLQFFSPQAINSSGQMIDDRFLWQNGTRTLLGAVHARSINDLGQVVGGSLILSNGQSHAFLWQNGILFDLGTLPGYTNSAAYDINTNGQVIGVCSNPDRDNTRWSAFLFALDSSGSVTSRVDLGGFTPQSINNRGEVVGIGYSAGNIRFACLWDKDHGVRDLNTLISPGPGSGWNLIEACGINDRGQIAASSRPDQSPERAVLLTPLPAPRLTLAAMQPNGQFRFTLMGEAGRSYTIQASTNLLNWTVVTNFVSVTGTNQFTDSAASNFNRRFYRAVTP